MSNKLMSSTQFDNGQMFICHSLQFCYSIVLCVLTLALYDQQQLLSGLESKTVSTRFKTRVLTDDNALP